MPVFLSLFPAVTRRIRNFMPPIALYITALWLRFPFTISLVSSLFAVDTKLIPLGSLLLLVCWMFSIGSSILRPGGPLPVDCFRFRKYLDLYNSVVLAH